MIYFSRIQAKHFQRTYKYVSIVPCQSSEELVGISAPDAEASEITSPELVPREGEAVECHIIVRN